ncbi:urate hydroxylase PuuD [Thiomicrorhabdus hydrogeniphila]
MDPQIIEWLNLNIKWIHLIVGIAWIGASFYFNWLEGNLERNKPGLNKGVAGDLWAVHGGGFYHVEKFENSPEKLPDVLHWFKWEAYLTWITGFAMMILVFYMTPSMTLVDSSVMDISPNLAIAISLLSMLLSWVVYDQLCKTKLSENGTLFFWIIFIGLTVVAYVLTQIFSAKAAYIHVGAIIGTIMVANVFFGIIPSQKTMVKAMEKGEIPDPIVGKLGYQRSLHNNYFTLPVLFIMISGHYPLTYGSEYNWLVLAAISLIGVFVRHYFNLKNRGQNKVWMLPVAAILMAVLAYLTMPKKTDVTLSSSVSYEQIAPVIQQRCATCHAVNPTDPAFKVAPKGVALETQSDLERNADMVYAQTVTTHVMPIGNLTKMTEQERTLLDGWYQTYKQSLKQ